MESKLGDEVDHDKENSSKKYDEENQQWEISKISYNIIGQQDVGTLNEKIICRHLSQFISWVATKVHDYKAPLPILM
jgi:hypothetical protein